MNRNEKIYFVMIGVLLVIITGLVVSTVTNLTGQDSCQQELKTVKAQLAQKIQEYDWLKELTDFALDNDGKLPPIERTEPFKST